MKDATIVHQAFNRAVAKATDKQAAFESQNRTIALAKMLEYEILEKMPEAYRSQANKNRARAIRQGIEAIAGTTAKTKDQDHADNYTWALWRVYNVLIGSTLEELETMAEGLEKLKAETELKTA